MLSLTKTLAIVGVTICLCLLLIGSMIYIDPDSKEFLELGTKSYPYKTL